MFVRIPPSPPTKKGLFFRPFFIGGVRCVDEPAGSTNSPGANLDDAKRRPEGLRPGWPQQSHPLRHLIFEAFLRLESLRSFPTAKPLQNRGFQGTNHALDR